MGILVIFSFPLRSGFLRLLGSWGLTIFAVRLIQADYLDLTGTRAPYTFHP